MLHLIYKKLKKQKILLLSTSFSLAPTLLVSCFQPYQEMQKHISKSLVPTPGSYNPKSANPVAGNPILEENSDTITNSVLGFNGQKKNPKEAKNRFNVEKNYTEEIPEASFIPNKGGTGKYGLLPYWYFLQSIPEYLKKKGFNTYKYNKEEYLKRLDYFYEKIRGYYNRNLVDYQSYQNPGEVEVWKQGLRKSYEDFIKKMNGKSTYDFNEDLTDKDKVKSLGDIDVNKVFSIIKPELDRYKVQIPNDETIKYAIVFDFLLANERIWPSSVDKPLLSDDDSIINTARYFRDDYYIEKRYQPSNPEKLWYELGWFMMRVQRIHQAADSARSVLEFVGSIEKYLFEINDKNQDIGQQLAGKLRFPIASFVSLLANFLNPKNHLNLRKDLVFNIDASNNQDDQSLIADLIQYYNQKIAPIIWRINLKRTDNKLDTLTKLVKKIQFGNYFNTYLQPLLPKIQDLPTQEDAKIGNNYSEELKEKARQGAKKAGQKAWGQWLKNYQDKYGIQFKADPEIDNEYYDESNSSVVKPEKTKEIEKEKLTKETKETKEELPKETKVS